MNRLPPEAFETYAALGPDRSYQALAGRYGVSKTAVNRRAKEERWQERLEVLERRARQESEDRIVEELKAVKERQLQGARFLQARALEALKSLPPERGIRAANALATAWKHELLLLGEATERQENVEEITKRELARWLYVETPDGTAATRAAEDESIEIEGDADA